MTIRVYGNPTCSDCIRTKRFLAARGIVFDYLDIESDPAAARFVVDASAGSTSRIPVVVLPDGSTLLEPTDEELGAVLGLALGP